MKAFIPTLRQAQGDSFYARCSAGTVEALDDTSALLDIKGSIVHNGLFIDNYSNKIRLYAET